MSSCTDIDAALARLEAKIDAIPRIDEQSIINRASSDAQSKLNPKISEVGVFAAGAVVTATQSQSIATVARELADDALRLGANLLGRVGALAGELIGLASRFAGILSLVFNLVATVATFAILSSRIDTLERTVRTQQEIINAATNQANKAVQKSDEAILKSNAATAKADLAIGNANTATIKASNAVNVSTLAIKSADAAILKANGAINKADKAILEASNANGTANRVAGELPAMKKETGRAHTRISDLEKGIELVYKDFLQRIKILTEGFLYALGNAIAEYSDLHDIQRYQIGQLESKIPSIDQASRSALRLAGEANATASTSITLAGKANATANNASSTANRALREVDELRSPVATASRKADQAQGTANQVSAQVPPLRLLSERAYADALKAFNKVQTDVPPVVSGIEQVRRASASIEQQFRSNSNTVQEQFKGINSTIQSKLAQPNQIISRQQQTVIQQFQTAAPALNNRVTALERTAVNPADSATLKRIETQIANFPRTVGAPTTEQIKEALTPGLLAIPLAVGSIVLPRLLNPAQVTSAAKTAICQEAAPNACLGKPLNNLQNGQNRQNNLLQGLGAGLQAGQGALLTAMNNTLNGVSRGVAAVNATALTINTKMGASMAGGLSGGLGRMSNFLGIDRALNLLSFLANLHNASMLTSSLKVTLLETLSSVGNATGLLQTSEGDNVDLNKTFNQGIEGFIVGLIGAESWASMKLTWRKYSPIYRAGSNVLSNVGNMFSSIGNGIEVIGERSGKIGNALRAAGVVRENAYNYMSENMNVHTSKFMTFQTTIGGATQVLEAINEVAESVIEGQESYTEAVKATTEFKKALAEGEKKPGLDADNAVIKAEAEKIKANLVKDPTGEDETGLLSFLTDL